MRTLVALFAVVSLVACSKQAPPVSSITATPPPPTLPEPAMAASAEEVAQMNLEANFSRVFFELDSAALAGDSMDALRSNATILQENPTVRVRIQGHADERGTVDYNMALAMKRAKRVRDALVQMGVSGQQLTTVSYGEEMPLVDGSGEGAWSKNRRAEFRVTFDPDGLVDGSVDNPVSAGSVQ